MTPGAILSMKELLKAKSTKAVAICEEPKKRVLPIPFDIKVGENDLICGGYGIGKTLSERKFNDEFMDAEVQNLNDYKAPTMRSNIRKGRRK